MQPSPGHIHARIIVVSEDSVVTRFAWIVIPVTDPRDALASVPHIKTSVIVRSDKHRSNFVSYAAITSGF